MTNIKSYRELIVWQKAMDLVIKVYQLARMFPRSERYRLGDQLLRAAISVPANIAEGHVRSTARDYAHFLATARGSLMEAETFLLLALRLDYLEQAEAASALQLVDEVSKMLRSLRNKLLALPPA